MCVVTITAVDRLVGGLILAFSDGSTGVFSSSLLYSMLDQAQQVGSQEESFLDFHLLFPPCHG